MPECAVGHRSIDGFAWKVKVGGHDAAMCEFHGRTCQHGQKMAKLLGVDHPLLGELLEVLDRQMDAACPAGRITSSREPGAEGQTEPPTGVLSPAALGSLTELAVS